MGIKMTEPENPPYVTVMQGVDVYCVVLMVYSRAEGEYHIARSSRGYKTRAKADDVADIWAVTDHAEVRR